MGRNMLVATENNLMNSLILSTPTDSHTFSIDLQELQELTDLNDLNNRDYSEPRQLPQANQANQANQGHGLHPTPPLLLHERDLAVLADLLERDDTPEILANINESLVCLSPEPGWDDFPENLLEIFDFLF
ncbi:MAG: hypothetical protein HC916_04380 [Coleofasciculaceae cyanobacterium SM2_1_6]|nr:hypothetical protein [Coleofasciculaceae cyanobacterium SM2_1_6]